MKNYFIELIIPFLILTSCNNQIEADFEIINNTEHEIDSLKIEPNVRESGKYISLKKSEMAEYKSDMTTIAKTDGAYLISFLIDGKKKTQVFGYYTNGYPIEKLTRIQIEKDTLKFDFEFNDY